MVWDNIFGLKSNCKISLATTPPQDSFDTKFCYNLQIPFSPMYSLVFSPLWWWTNNLDINPCRCLDSPVYSPLLNSNLCDHRDEKLFCMYKKPANLHSTCARQSDFYQICARHIQPSCKWSVEDLLSLRLSMRVIHLASPAAAPRQLQGLSWCTVYGSGIFLQPWGWILGISHLWSHRQPQHLTTNAPSALNNRSWNVCFHTYYC